jgi:predicted DNA-binding transcriptional regulator
MKTTQDAETRTNENIKTVEVLVLADRRMKVSMIADKVGISEATVLKNLNEDLGMQKVSVGWILKLLNPEQKLCRQNICKETLGALSDDEKLF